MSETEILVVVVAMLLGAVVKGAVGAGLPTIAIPVMAGFIGVVDAVVIMAIPTVVTNTWLVARHRRALDQTRDLPVLLVTGGIGVVLGAWILDRVAPAWLMFTLAAVIVLYAAVFLTRPTFEISPDTSRLLAPPMGSAAGLLQGATGMSGALLTTYTHALRLPRPAFMVQLVTQIQVFTVVQVASFALLGLYDTERLLGSLLAIVPALVGLPLGMRLGTRLPPRPFELLVLVVLGGMAIKLVVDGIGAL
ncbi:sulfite exporter TauE/SafE family protein [Egibacter rhizosphaerae]|uniref:Probable membrane transporter protein n=1 Tax=Egibacter rhizosphaerae TaxID=1670831 RepID=A0A411YJW2_9ACTN|nr:sulfite exporter TauE/SafE family protein [Egibacter rhizosphaerae]QBI21486.1 sulfite exporter TauE/SafE family protein [Egibacter rhizosphaerae]